MVEGGTPQAEIDHVLAIVAALLADNDQATCLAFVSGKDETVASASLQCPACIATVIEWDRQYVSSSIEAYL